MDAANEQPTQARWQEIESLFLEALAYPVGERTAFLGTACAGDEALGQEVAAMLAAHEEAADDYLETLDVDQATVLLQETDILEQAPIGPYRIVNELGRGGMGTVYLAERADGQFEQQVALKLIKPGMDSEAVLRRFLTERQILARLQHPNIARFLGGGLTDDGRPYFAMEYTDGRPLLQYCDENRLSIEARLRLFEGVCEAVHYAHRNLVVHRDLKPSNILITNERQVKLLDFGISKMLSGATDADRQMRTETGFRAMTPEYAAPEQVRGETITTATDVYALGAILYELLTGRRPYHFEHRTADTVARVICDTEPMRPSTAISRIMEGETGTAATSETVSLRRASSRTALRRRLAGDLDTVVLKALRKEPERRYASAEAFLEDIKRHLAGLPVTARPNTWSYRTTKFVQRHGWGTVAAISFVLLLISFIAVYTRGIEQEKQASQHEAERARLMVETLRDLLETADPYAWGAQRGDSLLLKRGQQKVTTDLTGEPDLQISLLTTLGVIYRKRGQYDEARRLLEQALAIARATYAKPHPRVIAALRELGYYYSDIGAYAQAEPFYQEVLTMQRQVFGDTHPKVTNGLTMMAQLKVLEGHEAEAETMMRQVVALVKDTPADSAYLASLWKLARVLYSRGKFAEAEQHFLEILVHRREKIGETNREVALTLQWLGLVLTDKGDFAVSEAYLRQALALQRQLLGDKHQDVAVSLFGLGLLKSEQTHYAEAMAFLKQSIAMTRQVFDEDHRDTAFHMQILGEVYRMMGQYEQAETVLREALRMNQQALGAEHLRVAETEVSLGKTLNDKGDFVAAKAVFEQALATFQRKGLLQRRGRLEAMAGYGELLTRMGRPEDAEPLLREAVSALTDKIVAPHSRYVLYAKSALANCLAAQQRYAEAEAVFRDIFTTYHAHYGPDYPRTQQAQRALRELYAAWGKPEKASAYRTAAAQPTDTP